MEFFDTTIFVGLIAAIATVLSASIPYYLGKRNERDDKIREKKISTYDELTLKLTEYIVDLKNMKAGHEFILAYNRAIGYGDSKVIESCDKFLNALSSTDADIDQVNAAINEIFRNIRKDLNPKVNPASFEIWNLPKS
jgi:hypothetical protein